MLLINDQKINMQRVHNSGDREHPLYLTHKHLSRLQVKKDVNQVVEIRTFIKNINRKYTDIANTHSFFRLNKKIHPRGFHPYVVHKLLKTSHLFHCVAAF